MYDLIFDLYRGIFYVSQITYFWLKIISSYVFLYLKLSQFSLNFPYVKTSSEKNDRGELSHFIYINGMSAFSFPSPSSPWEYAVIFYPSTLPFRKHVISCVKNKSQALRFHCVPGIRKPTRKFSNQTCKSPGQIFSFVREWWPEIGTVE